MLAIAGIVPNENFSIISGKVEFENEILKNK